MGVKGEGNEGPVGLNDERAGRVYHPHARASNVKYQSKLKYQLSGHGHGRSHGQVHTMSEVKKKSRKKIKKASVGTWPD